MVNPNTDGLTRGHLVKLASVLEHGDWSARALAIELLQAGESPNETARLAAECVDAQAAYKAAKEAYDHLLAALPPNTDPENPFVVLFGAAPPDTPEVREASTRIRAAEARISANVELTKAIADAVWNRIAATQE